MKIVVLGANGFIGEALSANLRAKEHDPVCVRTSGSPASHFPLDRNYDWLRPTVEGADVVYLCAGRTGGVGRMAQDPLSFLYPNVRIQMNVLESCAAVGVTRLVILQSTTGYPDNGMAMKEDWYLNGEPHPAYFAPGNAGRIIQRVSQMFPKLEVVFFRPSNVYGPGNNFDPQTSHVIEATVRKVAERQDPLVIWGSGEEVRDAIYIDDLAEAMTHARDCPPGAYNVGTGEEMSVNEMVGALCRHAAHEPAIEHDLSKPTAIPARRVDCTKLRALGWLPTVTMREGLGLTLDWFNASR